jgi:hypothetical protein
VVRAFVRMREMLAKNRQLAARINELDRRLETHDTAIQDIIDAIKELCFRKDRRSARSVFSCRLARREVLARSHTCTNNYLRRCRYKLPSTCFAMASTSSGTSRNFATLSAVCLGSRKTVWYCTRLTFTWGLPLSQPYTSDRWS